MDAEAVLFDERRVASTAEKATYRVEFLSYASSPSPSVASYVFRDVPVLDDVIDWTRRMLGFGRDSAATIYPIPAGVPLRPVNADIHAIRLLRLVAPEDEDEFGTKTL